MEGITYSKWLLPFNILFFISNNYFLRYDEYIVYVKRNKKKFVIRSVIATTLILLLIIGFQFAQKDEIKEFALPREFVILMLMLQF